MPPTAGRVPNTRADATVAAIDARTTHDALSTSLAAASSGFSWPAPGVLLVLAWLAGTLAAVTTLGVSLLRVWRLARTSQAINGGDSGMARIGGCDRARLGLRRQARLLVHARVATHGGGLWPR